MKLGSVAQKVLPKTHSLQSSSPDIFYAAGFLIGIILWSFGLVWFFFAVASIFKTRTFPFNIGWWGFTFPIGVFATATCQMGQELPSTFFNILGTVCSLHVADWLVVTRVDHFPLCGNSVGGCQHRDDTRNHHRVGVL